jgi:hypothetical protein
MLAHNTMHPNSLFTWGTDLPLQASRVERRWVVRTQFRHGVEDQVCRMRQPEGMAAAAAAAAAEGTFVAHTGWNTRCWCY